MECFCSQKIRDCNMCKQMRLMTRWVKVGLLRGSDGLGKGRPLLGSRSKWFPFFAKYLENLIFYCAVFNSVGYRSSNSSVAYPNFLGLDSGNKDFTEPICMPEGQLSVSHSPLLTEESRRVSLDHNDGRSRLTERHSHIHLYHFTSSADAPIDPLFRMWDDVRDIMQQLNPSMCEIDYSVFEDIQDMYTNRGSEKEQTTFFLCYTCKPNRESAKDSRIGVLRECSTVKKCKFSKMTSADLVHELAAQKAWIPFFTTLWSLQHSRQVLTVVILPILAPRMSAIDVLSMIADYHGLNI
ncbi:hypothetical protein GQR58_014747 [Nymphon striatum]|nr:hypothetical protein GQR58_014747 [Nymphon striatum]